MRLREALEHSVLLVATNAAGEYELTVDYDPSLYPSPCYHCLTAYTGGQAFNDDPQDTVVQAENYFSKFSGYDLTNWLPVTD